MVPLRRVPEQQERAFFLVFSRFLLHMRNRKVLDNLDPEVYKFTHIIQ
jgi:hypothetical protein